ncbi:MAG TPA: TIGR02253 family HAD-type hydrolase [Candidatus Bilamarchaeaceae archaeon]|nr:TIGR02253 family HAD-type hydrolase [Candidatus Bilamarchaeaceae archaeon]
MKIFFDIDNTLFNTKEFAELARKNAINAMVNLGLNQDPKQLYDRLIKIIDKKGSNYKMHFDDLCKELKLKKYSKYVAGAVAAYHNTKSTISPYPEVVKTLIKLKEEGHLLYVATNGNAIKQWDKLIRLGVAHFFDDAFVSEEIKHEKSKKFFEIVIKNTGSKKEKCVMVGDKEESDIVPAKQAGLIAIKVIKKEYKDQKSSADFQIDDLSQILEIIKTQMFR